MPSSTSSLLSSVITALARTSAYPGTTAAFARTVPSFIISKSGRRGILPLFFQNLVSARCLLGRACLGRGRTTRPRFALQRASRSISKLLFRGAGKEQQTTRRRRGRRSREDGTGYATVPPQTTGGQRHADSCSPQIEKQGGGCWVRGRAPSKNRRTATYRRLFPTNRTRV